jgi:hypothetical protein
MSRTVCVLTSTLNYPEGGGHLWVFPNWALGLRALGSKVIGLEAADSKAPFDLVRARVEILKSRRKRYGLADYLALYPWSARWTDHGLEVWKFSPRTCLESGWPLDEPAMLLRGTGRRGADWEVR